MGLMSYVAARARHYYSAMDGSEVDTDLPSRLRVVFLLYPSHQSVEILRQIVTHDDVLPVAIVESSVVDTRRHGWELVRFLAARERRWFVQRKVFEVIVGRAATAFACVTGFRGGSVRALSRRLGVALLSCADVNQPAFVEQLRCLDADLFVSIHFNHIFRAEAIQAAKLGTINVHGALLPRHRGLFPHLYALRDGDTNSGVTIHWIDVGIDTGRPIVSGSFPIGPSDTVVSVENRAAELGAKLLGDAIAKIRANGNGEHDGDAPVATLRGQYHSWPTRADRILLRERGRRYMCARDIVEMFRAARS